MIKTRLTWEPETLCDKKLVSRQVMKYMESTAAFAQFPNDSCLMLKNIPDIARVIEGAIKEARVIAEFKVYRMKDDDYLVFFASALMVYVGKDEFIKRKTEIANRLNDLSFFSEKVLPASPNSESDDLLVGLYARGKLQRDAWSPPNYTLVYP